MQMVLTKQDPDQGGAWAELFMRTHSCFDGPLPTDSVARRHCQVLAGELQWDNGKHEGGGGLCQHQGLSRGKAVQSEKLSSAVAGREIVMKTRVEEVAELSTN